MPGIYASRLAWKANDKQQNSRYEWFRGILQLSSHPLNSDFELDWWLLEILQIRLSSYYRIQRCAVQASSTAVQQKKASACVGLYQKAAANPSIFVRFLIIFFPLLNDYQTLDYLITYQTLHVIFQCIRLYIILRCQVFICFLNAFRIDQNLPFVCAHLIWTIIIFICQIEYYRFSIQMID